MFAEPRDHGRSSVCQFLQLLKLTRTQKVLEVHVVVALRQKIRRRPRNKELARTIPLRHVYLWVLQIERRVALTLQSYE